MSLRLAHVYTQYPSAIKYYKAAIKLKCSLNNGDFNHAEIGEFLANLGDVFRKVIEQCVIRCKWWLTA
jgi:hypothetical protein